MIKQFKILKILNSTDNGYGERIHTFSTPSGFHPLFDTEEMAIQYLKEKFESGIIKTWQDFMIVPVISFE